MAIANVKITNELKNPSEVGTHFRLICMTGPNKGKVYYLTGKRILIGRGDKTDIQIVDTKISREHAELSLTNDSYVITDMSNQNGIMINDLKVKQKKLSDGEKIVLGQTVLKYNVIKIYLERNDLVNIDNNVIDMPQKEVGKNKVNLNPKLNLKSSASAIDLENDEEEIVVPKKEGGNKAIFLIVILAGVAFLFFAKDDPIKVNKPKVADKFDIESDATFANRAKGKEDPESKKKFDILIHSGRREFREGNYFRAMEEFRRADLVMPGSGMAGYLMSRSKQRLDDDVLKNFDKANKDLDAKKYQTAIISLCGVMQLLQNYPEDERYKNAQDKIHGLEVEMGIEKGEVKCFEEKSTGSRN